MNLLGMSNLLDNVVVLADELFTSDEERLKVRQQDRVLETSVITKQLEVNQTEAKHSSIFVAGWRPAIGWVGALAMGYQFLLYPLLTWLWSYGQATGALSVQIAAPPTLPADALWVIISGILGIAGMRSFDKNKSLDTKLMK